VKQGTFQYRTSYGRATLAPGALLLGDAGQCFECSHEHGIGDRCLSFHFAPDYFKRIVADVRGARLPFTVPRFAPSESLIPLLVAADPAPHDAMELEEIALRLAGLVATRLSRTATSAATPSRHNERRMSEAVRRLEADPETPTTLTALARNCGMSPYHFLRTFRSVVGITPHQFVLAQRLRRAAVRLRESDEPISRIVFDAGFNDLSTFNRRFRRVMGATPTAFRRVRHRALPRLCGA
jgi:AraC family transcriptional regulator